MKGGGKGKTVSLGRRVLKRGKREVGETRGFSRDRFLGGQDLKQHRGGSWPKGLGTREGRQDFGKRERVFEKGERRFEIIIKYLNIKLI